MITTYELNGRTTVSSAAGEYIGELDGDTFYPSLFFFRLEAGRAREQSEMVADWLRSQGGLLGCAHVQAGAGGNAIRVQL